MDCRWNSTKSHKERFAFATLLIAAEWLVPDATGAVISSWRTRPARAVALAPPRVENALMEAVRFPKLMTPRLVLRAPSERDIPAWFARATDVESASLAGDHIPSDIGAGERWLARSRQRFADGRAIQWSIDQAGVSDAIGTITLSFGTTDAKAAALGFVLARAHWGHGMGSEAAREVLRYAFETLALEQVTAEAATRNFASLRILAKLGFKHIESFIDVFDGERCERFALDADIGSSLLTSKATPDR